jgi:hypothetical protein
LVDQLGTIFFVLESYLTPQRCFFAKILAIFTKSAHYWSMLDEKFLNYFWNIQDPWGSVPTKFHKIFITWKFMPRATLPPIFFLNKLFIPGVTKKFSENFIFLTPKFHLTPPNSIFLEPKNNVLRVRNTFFGDSKLNFSGIKFGPQSIKPDPKLG